MKRLAGAAVGALAIVGAILPQPTLAATRVRIDPGGIPFAEKIPVSEALVFVDGDQGINEIRIVWKNADREFLVRDSEARVVAPDCTKLGEHVVRCPYSNQDLFGVSGYAGDDRISLGDAPDRAQPSAYGGSGDDAVIGSKFQNFLYAGSGDDTLWGRAGNDYLIGSAGRDVVHGGTGNDKLGREPELGIDSLLGGPGADRINAADRTPDRELNAGPGQDRCRIDDENDPPPLGCEEVRRGPRPDPFGRTSGT